MKKEDFRTKCPFCKIGFTMMCASETAAQHVDIMWTSDAGQIFECGDKTAIISHIVLNKDFGTGYSLSPEMQGIFTELNEDFHKDPSKFDKTNTDSGSFFGLIGEFFRYSEYMDERELREDINVNEVADQLYEEGKNIKEILDTITYEQQKESSEVST